MIELWPAIDLIQNQSVRLTEGKYDSKKIMNRTPQEAIQFYSRIKQVKRIHIVDLMGALHQKPVEKKFISELIEVSPLPIEIGGGIRSKETIEYYLDSGASYIIIGTRGLQEIKWLKKMTQLFPNKIYLGLDAKEEQVAVNGWTKTEDRTIYDIINEIGDFQLGGIIYTDISKDGKMQGPNIKVTEKLVNLSPHPIIASGGIRNMKDIKELENIEVKAAIIGKAANTNTFWEEMM